MRISVRVNGDEQQADCWEGESLLYALREKLGFPGSKNTCEQGECGSCSVLLDGTLVPRPPRRPLSAGSVLNLHLLLTQALGQAVRWQLLTETQPQAPNHPDPGAAHPSRRPAAPPHLLDELPGHPLELPFAIAIATGMRRGEILALRWHDLTPDYTTAHIQQTLQPSAPG